MSGKESEREMAESEQENEGELLNQVMAYHFNTMQDAFQLFGQTPPGNATKVSWEDVLKMGDQVYEHATAVGTLWTGQRPKFKAIEGGLQAYISVLQGFLSFANGSLVGAGPTLSVSIIGAVKKVFSCSFDLMTASVCSYRFSRQSNKEMEILVTNAVGTVLDACSALKKLPTTNITAIGRAMSQEAVALKNALQMMKELKPARSDPDGGVSDEPSTPRGEGSKSQIADCSSEEDSGNNLSPAEMKVADAASGAVSDIVTVIKELIRFITGLLKIETSGDSPNFVASLERLLMHCKLIASQVDGICASLYPPQEASAVMVASGEVRTCLGDMLAEVKNLGGTPEAFFEACDGVRSSLQQLEHEVSLCRTVGLEGQMQSTSLND